MANIKEAIEYAKLNPNTTFATELRRRIESGQMDNELQGAGLTQYITPKEPGGLSRVVDTYSKNLKEQALGGVENAQKSFAMGVDTMQQAQQIPLDSGANKDKAILTGAAGAGQIGVGAASGLVQTYFSPLTALVQTGVQGLKELDTATGGKIQNQLTTLAQSHPELIKGYSDMVTQNPKTAQFVMDSINVLTAGLGAKPLATATTDLTKGAITGAKEAISNIPKVSPMSVVPKNLSQKAVDLISSDPEKKVATILKESTPEQLDNYLSIAEKAASDPRIATPFEVVGNKLSDTTKILETKLKDIGARKSAVIEPMREGLGSFKKETTPLIQKLTSLKNSFTEIDRGNKAKVQAIINDAKTISTKRGADAFIDKVQNALYVGHVDMTIPRGSALDKQLEGIIGEYNTSLKNSLPEEYGVLNKQYSDLIDSLDVINRSLGEVVEGVPVRGASLIKQFFSPSGTKAKEIFEFVKKETNGEVDLAKDATLAKFSMDLFDDPRSRSLLAGIGDIPTSVGGVVTKVAEKLGGDKLQEAMRSATIRKAKEISSQKSAKESYSAPKEGVKSESPSSANTTPTSKKGKGIRGMVNPSGLLPEKKVADSLEQEAKKYNSAEEFASSDKHIIDRSGELVKVGDKVTFARGGSEFNGKLVKVKNFDGSYDSVSTKGKDFKDYSPEVVVEATEDVYNKGGFPIHKKGDKFNVGMYQINGYKDGYKPVKTKSQLIDIWNKANKK